MFCRLHGNKLLIGLIKKHNITFISESTEYGLLWTIKSQLIDNSKKNLKYYVI